MSSLASRASNRSYFTEGTDNPTQEWLQRRVRVRSHPEWGVGRVLRWYPARAGNPPTLRVMMDRVRAPKIVKVTDVVVVD